jgi:hypothetical protein
LNRRSYCIRLRPTLTNKSFFGSFFSKKELLFSKKKKQKKRPTESPPTAQGQRNAFRNRLSTPVM